MHHCSGYINHFQMTSTHIYKEKWNLSGMCMLLLLLSSSEVMGYSNKDNKGKNCGNLAYMRML